MPLPARDGKPDPDAIYYDHPANDNVSTRTKTNVSIFDEPVARRSTPEVRDIKIEYKTYLVGANGPLWEISWTFSASGDAQGMHRGQVTDIKGRSAKTFAAPLNSAQWNIGRRVDPATGRPSDKTEQAKNPFFKQ